MLRQIVNDAGVDPDDSATLIDLAAVAVARMAWRDGPVEDWHTSVDSRLDDAEMLRANAATTRLVRDLLARHLPGPPTDRQAAVRGGGPGEMFVVIAAALTDPDRRLPNGQRLAELAPDRPSLQRYRSAVRTWCSRWVAITDQVGLHPVLLFLACWTLTTSRHWWLGPDWPLIVDRFLRQLDHAEIAGDCASARDAGLPADREVLRRQLLAGPDQLSSLVAAFCLRHGLGRHVLPGSETR